MKAVVDTHRNRLEPAQQTLLKMREALLTTLNADWQTLLLHNEGVL